MSYHITFLIFHKIIFKKNPLRKKTLRNGLFPYYIAYPLQLHIRIRALARSAVSDTFGEAFAYAVAFAVCVQSLDSRMIGFASNTFDRLLLFFCAGHKAMIIGL